MGVVQWLVSPGRGDSNKASNSFAAPRLFPFNAGPPTASAVGYFLALLRS